jgi:two-component SAPR family response regulator
MHQDVALAGRRILVVEDEFLVAEYLGEILRSAGAQVLGPLGRVAEALAFVEANKDGMDAVVLDVNLHGQPSFPIADLLVRHGIRFVFTTGYDGAAIDAAYRNYPRCEKPFCAEALLAALVPATA